MYPHVVTSATPSKGQDVKGSLILMTSVLFLQIDVFGMKGHASLSNRGLNLEAQPQSSLLHRQQTGANSLGTPCCFSALQLYLL